jgi:hypothetical protein
MKSKLFMAAIAVAMIFSSCNNEEIIDNGTTNLTVRIEAATTASRALQAPGTANAINLNSGVIFLIAPDGSATATAMVPAQVQGTGQVFSSVPSSSRVFVVANATTTAQTALLAATSFTQIQAILTATLDYQTTLYNNVALSNANGNPAGITVVNPTTATVNVTISPVITRLELAGVTGGTYIEMDNATPAVPTGNQTRITGFDVIGVFVDSYAPNFTYTGESNGTLIEINQQKIADPAFTPAWGGVQDRSTWTAAGSPLVAAPASPSVWAYNLPATDLPRLIIAVQNVAFDVSADNGATWTTATGTNYTGIQYITVGGYNVTVPPAVTPSLATALNRGVIYQISANDMTFTTDNLHGTPNPVEVNLTVNVTVQNWVLAPTNPILE